MSFEAGLAVAMSLIVATLIADWPRAVIGLVVGAFGIYIPYSTLAVPIIAVLVAGLAEVVYPIVGHTSEPTLGSFAMGAFCAIVSACSVYVTMRNLKDRF